MQNNKLDIRLVDDEDGDDGDGGGLMVNAATPPSMVCMHHLCFFTAWIPLVGIHVNALINCHC